MFSSTSDMAAEDSERGRNVISSTHAKGNRRSLNNITSNDTYGQLHSRHTDKSAQQRLKSKHSGRSTKSFYYQIGGDSGSDLPNTINSDGKKHVLGSATGQQPCQHEKKGLAKSQEGKHLFGNDRQAISQKQPHKSGKNTLESNLESNNVAINDTHQNEGVLNPHIGGTVSPNRTFSNESKNQHDEISVHGLEEVWGIMDMYKQLVVEKNQSEASQSNAMMRKCATSEEMRLILTVEMREAKIKPDVMSYNTLVSRLMLEGDVDLALRCVNEDMPAAGLRPDERTWKALEPSDEDLDAMRANQLNSWIEKADDESMRAAWNLFNVLAKRRKATTRHFNSMMGVCKSSNQIRQLMEEDMLHVGVKPDVVSYTHLVNRLMVEGDALSAWNVIDEEMPSAGIIPDARTYTALKHSVEDLEKLYRDQLTSFIQEPGSKGLQKAWVLYNKLVEKNKASTSHLNLMLKGCLNSDQMMDLVNADTKQTRHKPDIVSYTHLISQLMIEGDELSARRVVDEDMSNANIWPGARTKKTLELSANQLNRMRTKQLSSLISKGGHKRRKAAWALYRKLLEKKQANAFHFSIMMTACHNSKKIRRIIDVDMKLAGIKPDVVAYTILVSMLRKEGDTIAAQLVIDQEMPASGVKPDARAYAARKKFSKNNAKKYGKKITARKKKKSFTKSSSLEKN